MQTYNAIQVQAQTNPSQYGELYIWAQRVWRHKPIIEPGFLDVKAHPATNLHLSVCYSCDEVSLCSAYDLVYPTSKTEVFPNTDIPPDAKADFEEAATIVDLSPRGAAALLRLALQKMLKSLGQSGENINQDIAALVQQGLPVAVQRALDVVRVIGNNAVHPGEIDMRDDKATATRLFALVNIIAEAMITQPKQIGAMFEDLPQGAIDAIERRDKPKP
ncbi:DUF4145 domain-containing protein [Methylobacterium goesingense]|uniref:DUF4145 domain-containing protein n=1 Tax=Methylobacterium goesingense TaxID=243690 RepID=A0ABV2L5R4_9HYPH|nr:DUF4145 domain-containing protein [Methylobacterium goesingense]